MNFDKVSEYVKNATDAGLSVMAITWLGILSSLTSI